MTKLRRKIFYIKVHERAERTVNPVSDEYVKELNP